MPDIVTGKTFVDGEKGITATKLNQIISQAVIQPSFVTAKPASSTLDPTDQLLEVKGAGTYATITGSQLISSVSSQIDVTSQITGIRLRSFNALGNPTFECDQINVGSQINVGAGTQAKQCDRWYTQNFLATGSPNFFGQQVLQNSVVPGTNFLISNKAITLTFGTQKASLAAGDTATFTQSVEGSATREIINDITSLSLLVSTNVVGGLKFSIAIRDAGYTRSLVKLCVIPTANTPTLIQLPNIPVFASGGGWNYTPGLVGYVLTIGLAIGSTYMAPANDVWQNGNFLGAVGMDNFFSKPANSTLTIAFIQHEPGAQCSTLMDKPFTQNLTECLRYYCKSYPYGTAVGAPSVNGYEVWANPYLSTTAAWGGTKFPVPLAKAPNVQIYSPVSGAAPALRFITNAADWTVASSQSTEKGINSLSFSNTGAGTTNALVSFHYSADTGW